MSEANIAIKATDQFSTKVNSMANASKGLSKAMEEAQRKAQQMSQRQDALIRSNAKLKTSLEAAGKELKAAKKAFQDTGNAADAKALEEAQEKYDRLKMSIADTTQELKDCQKEMRSLEAQERRGGSGGGGGSGNASSSLAASLGKSGLASAVGNWAAELGGSFIQSMGGDEASTMFSSILGMGGTGAAIGTSIMPGIGTAIGAAVGAVAGAISGAVKIFEKKDEYYKDAVKESYEGFKQAREELISTGSSVAAGREVDELAFNKLLGEGIGTEYLADLRDLAAHTPLEYDQLTEISRQLAIGFGDESDRMLELIEVVGDAGSAVGLDSGGMVTIATALSRMQSSDKVTLEYLNLIQERGIDAIGIIGQAKGMTTAQVYDAISKGTLDGSDIVDVLQEGMAEKYGGSMQEQSQTYSGLESTLSDQETERQNLAGEAFNETRATGRRSQIAFNDSEVGQKVMAIDSMGGSTLAMGENMQEAFERAALTFLHTGEGLRGWSESGLDDMTELRKKFLETYSQWVNEEDPIAKATLEARLKNYQDEARAQAEAAYSQSEFAKELAEADKDFIDGLQSAQANGYWQLGYEIGQQLSQGIRAAVHVNPPPGEVDVDLYPTGGAYGVHRIPYNDYPMRLHEGERVLTAQQARQMDAAGGHAGGVVITGNNFTVREDADVTRIASELVRQIRSAQMVYAG